MTTTYTINDLNTVAREILANMTSKTLLLDGAMGSGKTTLVRALVKALGGDDVTSSPTFSIVNEYAIQDDIVYHFDLYRIDNDIEALDFGIEDYLYSGHYNFIEWPEKIASLLPEETDILKLNINHDNSRSLTLNYAENLTY